MFEGEFQSLEEICRTDTLRVPRPIKVNFYMSKINPY